MVTDHGGALRAAVARVAGARADLAKLLLARDIAIRDALTDGVSGVTVSEETSLSRGQIDAIRRGLRRRS